MSSTKRGIPPPYCFGPSLLHFHRVDISQASDWLLVTNARGYENPSDRSVNDFRCPHSLQLCEICILSDACCLESILQEPHTGRCQAGGDWQMKGRTPKSTERHHISCISWFSRNLQYIQRCIRFREFRWRWNMPVHFSTFAILHHFCLSYAMLYLCTWTPVDLSSAL